ncbi:MAG TPA: SDR family NAD(P)-dependent oxidoreductase, partial [Nitrososphaera sp.]|nr:SDR family NAD(P)-dependent oxidoreductase [Nitrososphaera sp.]
MKSIIVTGASSGIGKVSAVMLANAGYRVYGLARNYSKLAKVGTQLPSDRYIPLEFDITMPETFDRIISEIARGGQIFGLVNNAGYVEPGAIEDLAMSDLRAQFETNFFGLVGMTKQVLPFMLAQGEGRIVNISSMAGLVSLPLVGAYCATKHALEAVSEALCMELWNTGVRVISINPGVIDTNIHAITSGKVSV